MAVIGGGAIGVSAAYYLALRGKKVVLLEKDQIGLGCSYGNAGLVVPGFTVPLATPRALSQGLRWLLRGAGPFTIHPALDVALMRWLLRYLAACRRTKVNETINALHSLASASLDCYRELAAELPHFGFDTRGWLHVFLDANELSQALVEADQLIAAGVAWEAVDGAQARELCGQLSKDTVGGIYFPDEAHLQPYAFVENLAMEARKIGAELREDSTVMDLKFDGDRVSELIVEGEVLAVDWCILAAGAESMPILQRYGIQLPIKPAKGYSLTWEFPKGVLDIPLMFGEAHVVVTPMGNQLRMTTGLDLVGYNKRLDPRRLEAIRKATARYLPGVAVKGEGEAWADFRALTPDSRPVIGPLKRFPNLLVASGHGQLGITLAPVTGKLISDLVEGERSFMDLTPFLPDRFGL